MVLPASAVLLLFGIIRSDAPPNPSALAGVQVLSAGHVRIFRCLFVCLTAYGGPHGQRRAGLRRGFLWLVACGVSAVPLSRPAPSLRPRPSAQPHTVALSRSSLPYRSW